MKVTNVVIVFIATTPHKKMRAMHCLFFLLKHKKDKTHKKTTKKTKRREGAYLQALALPFHFWLLVEHLCQSMFTSSFIINLIQPKSSYLMMNSANNDMPH
jgi:hypothetical protein